MTDIVKITFSKANDGIEVKIKYSSNETTKDMEVNSYKEAILRNLTKIKIKYLWKNGLF